MVWAVMRSRGARVLSVQILAQREPFSGFNLQLSLAAETQIVVAKSRYPRPPKFFSLHTFCLHWSKDLRSGFVLNT